MFLLHNTADFKEVRKNFLIVCEDKKSSVLYFQKMIEDYKLNRSQTISWKLEGTGRNTLSLVNFTKNFVKDEKEDEIEYDEVWCVFDRDSFPKDNFDNTIKSARANKYKPVYSNESFEVWYILHFTNKKSEIPLSRSHYKEKIEKLLKIKKYDKSDDSIYDKIKHNTEEAIKNSKILIKTYINPDDYYNNNPSTTVHELVEQLRKHRRP